MLVERFGSLSGAENIYESTKSRFQISPQSIPADVLTMSLKNEQEKYFMEGNSGEILRLSFQHEVLKEYVGKLVLAPVELNKPRLRVIDSATADGEKPYMSAWRADKLTV
jgi:hypothetical protein